jgi:hypothetical protein
MKVNKTYTQNEKTSQAQMFSKKTSESSKAKKHMEPQAQGNK